MPRRKSKTKVTKRKKPAKAIKLDPDIWVRSGKSINDYRSALLFDQEGLCAVSGLPLPEDGGVLDHCHADSQCNGVDGKVRGVLLSEINLLEGSIKKLFKKSKLNSKFGLTLPEVLVNLGMYLQQDNSELKYHYRYMDDLRKYITRLRKDQIELKLFKDFNIVINGNEDKRELVRMYIQEFVNLVEKREKEK